VTQRIREHVAKLFKSGFVTGAPNAEQGLVNYSSEEHTPRACKEPCIARAGLKMPRLIPSSRMLCFRKVRGGLRQN
jgi:hypothetical protein